MTIARATADARALAAALDARHVALWRPDRLHERLDAANEMVQAAHTAGERHLELQARNRRVVDLFELGEMQDWRLEVSRHETLAADLCLPAFAWYTPCGEPWTHYTADRSPRRTRCAARRSRRVVARVGPNADLFAQLLVTQDALLRLDFTAVDLSLLEEKVATSPAGMRVAQ